MKIFDRIEQIRVQKGMGQRELSRKMGLQGQSYHQMMRRGAPSLRTLERIAKALDVDISAFFSPGG